MAYRLSRAAIADVADALVWSDEHLGSAAAERYEALIQAALAHIVADPARPGSADRPKLGPGVRVWHLRLSRYGSSEDVVRRPRHFLVYRVEPDGTVAVGRLLHDRMDLQRHVDLGRDFDSGE